MLDGGGGCVAAEPKRVEVMTASESEGCATGLKILEAMVVFGGAEVCEIVFCW